MKVKYFTKSQLKVANEHAIKTNRNRTIKREAIRALPPGTRCPVLLHFIHNDCEIRAMIALNEKPDCVFIDIPFNIFNLLPSADVNV